MQGPGPGPGGPLSAAPHPSRRPGAEAGTFSGMLAWPWPAPACGFAARAAGLGLYPHSPLRGSAGLARRGAPVPPVGLALAHCAPSGPPRQGSGRAAGRRPCLAGALGGVRRSLPGPPLGRPCPRHGPALALLALAGVRAAWPGAVCGASPPLLPPGGRKAAPGAVGPPPAPPRDALRPPGEKVKVKGEKIHTCYTHAHNAPFWGCADQAHYFG